MKLAARVSTPVLALVISGCGTDSHTTTQPLHAAEAGVGDAGSEAGAPEVDAGPPVALVIGPPEIRGANGMGFNADGELYVGAVNAGTLYVLDPDTGETKRTLGADQGILAPDDLVIASDGTLYVANILQGTIVAFDPATGEHREVAAPGAGVDGIALSPDEKKLYVGKDFLGDGLYEIDLSGETPPRTVIEAPGWINAMRFGPDGVLYAPVWMKHHVARIDLEAGKATPLTKEFAGTAGAVKFDAKGDLYAVDGSVGDVYRIDTATGDMTALAHYGMPLDNLAFDSKGRLFISSYGDGSVHELREDGSLRVVKAGGLLGALGLAVRSGDSESILVGNQNGVPEFDAATGEYLSGFGAGIATGNRKQADAMRFDGDRLIVLSQGGAGVQEWDSTTGEVTNTFPVQGGVDVIRFSGATLVSQGAAGSVVAVDAAGATPFASGLGDPAGLAATETDLFVSIYTAGEIRQIAEGGAALDPPRVIASGLAAPEGLAVLPGGDLVVVETGTGNVLRVDRTTGETTVLAEALSPGAAEGATATLGTINAVAVGEGHVYVASPVDKKVWRVRL